MQIITLRLIGFIGAALYLSLLALTFSVPGWVESFASDYIETKAQERIDATIDSFRPPESDSALGRLAQSIYAKNQVKIESMKGKLKNKVHEKWAVGLASVRDLDCDCRQQWQDFFESGFNTSIGWLEAANRKVSAFIHATYMDVMTSLKKDIRIFAASNLLVFSLLLLISFLKPQASVHLFFPALLLALSTLICSYFYLFNQNWLLTIIHGDYVGYAYTAWLGVVFLFLSDILFNHGRVTTEILNGMFEAIGSSLSVGPC